MYSLFKSHESTPPCQKGVTSFHVGCEFSNDYVNRVRYSLIYSIYNYGTKWVEFNILVDALM